MINAEPIRGEEVSLEPIIGDWNDASVIHEVVKTNRHAIDAALPGVTSAYKSRRRALKRHEHIAARNDAEGYVVRDHQTGKLIGQVSLLQKTISELPSTSAQLDYWIFPERDRSELGVEVGRLIIARGFVICEGAPPHAWLYDEDPELSYELRALMEPHGDQTSGFMAGDPDRNAPETRAARLYIAKSP